MPRSPHRAKSSSTPASGGCKSTRRRAARALRSAVRGIPLGEHGFIRVNPHGEVPGVDRIYAAGDGVDFPIKHGGLSSQQADAAAESIAARAGAAVSRSRSPP